ncbi:MAG: polysaccharide biosynthesis protein, partial [Sulfuricurvum sp.]|nr:polysaccharide biosynthesis protein [Sulfuricurvum sp.]
VEEVPSLVEAKSITAAIIDGSLPNEYLREAYQLLSDAGIRDIKRSRLLDDTVNKIEKLSIEELLARHPKDLDTKTIGKFIEGKTILITGAGGSIGSELSLQCQSFGAKNLILIDHSEYNLYQIGEKLLSAKLHLCNILDRVSLDSIIDTAKPDIVIHAAAYKHVPLCEANIQSAIMNNVQGSRNVIDSAIEHNVPKIVIISTDKAVRPTNVMGTTKRIVELYAQNVDPKNSEIAAVRFGNVLGSSGSVIPKFKSQIESGGPITLTHPDITRYFMLISEACQLVLQATAIAKGKELFILDMGKPVKIIDLARTMIKLYAPKEIEIVLSGLRPGEKLYEELLMDENEQKTSYASIMIAGSTHYPIEQLNSDIENLMNTHDPLKILKKIVPEFIAHTVSLSERVC